MGYLRGVSGNIVTLCREESQSSMESPLRPCHRLAVSALKKEAGQKVNATHCMRVLGIRVGGLASVQGERRGLKPETTLSIRAKVVKVQCPCCQPWAVQSKREWEREEVRVERLYGRTMVVDALGEGK